MKNAWSIERQEEKKNFGSDDRRLNMPCRDEWQRVRVGRGTINMTEMQNNHVHNCAETSGSRWGEHYGGVE